MYKDFEAKEIIDVVSNTLGIDDITLKSKKPLLSHARFIAVKLMRRNTKLSYEEIGTALKRDKTSIYWCERRFDELFKSEHTAFLASWKAVWEAGRELCA